VEDFSGSNCNESIHLAPLGTLSHGTKIPFLQSRGFCSFLSVRNGQKLSSTYVAVATKKMIVGIRYPGAAPSGRYQDSLRSVEIRGFLVMQKHGVSSMSDLGACQDTVIM